MALSSSESSPLLPAEPAIERPSHKRFDSASSDPRPAATGPAIDSNDILRDTIIGFSDGLTVPFALTAGLSTLGSAKLVIMGGLAELFSGMISMGLGAYLAAATERDHYADRELAHRRAAAEGPDACRADLHDVLDRYGVAQDAARPLVDDLCRDRDRCVRFLMDVGLRLDRPNIHAAWVSAATMGLSYFVGGLIPMVPYFLMHRVREALFVSVAVTVAVLLAFGYAKNFVAIRNHRAGAWGAVQTLVIGMLAAGTSYAIVRALDAGGT